MTRRFFTQLFAGIVMSMPIRAEYSQRVDEPTTLVAEHAGPLSPLRKAWPALDMDKFVIGLQWELTTGGYQRMPEDLRD